MKIVQGHYKHRTDEWEKSSKVSTFYKGLEVGICTK